MTSTATDRTAGRRQDRRRTEDGGAAAAATGEGRSTGQPAGRALLRAAGLTVGYRQRRRARPVLRDLDLDLPASSLTCLLGMNGSGKTTLLRTLAGSLPALAGSVELAGQRLAGLSPTDRARHLAVVLTSRVDAGLLTVGDVVALGRHPYTGWSGRLGSEDHEAIDWALEACGVQGLRRRAVPELSDGERQRVMLARALAQEPDVLLLDEPTAFVDLPRRLELVELLGDLARTCGLAVLLTSHDLDLVLRTADLVWLLDAPPGNGTPGSLQVGAPEDLALAGALATAFDTERVRYDLTRARFAVDGAAPRTVEVSGQGLAYRWTVHAVERAGFTVAAATALSPTVTVLDGPRWRVEGTDTAREHATLGEVVADLRGRAEDR